MMKQMLIAGSVLMLLSVSAHAGNGLPQSMVGEWCYQSHVGSRTVREVSIYTRGRCPEPSNENLTIQQNSYHWQIYYVNDHRIVDGCTINKVRRLRGKSLRSETYVVHASCDSEGLTWTETKIFKLVCNELQVETLSGSDQKAIG
jgi:hypothetical protein